MNAEIIKNELVEQKNLNLKEIFIILHRYYLLIILIKSKDQD